MNRVNILSFSDTLASNKPYPERSEVKQKWYDLLAEYLMAVLVSPIRHRVSHSRFNLMRVARLTDRYASKFEAFTNEELAQHAQKMRGRLRRQGFKIQISSACFALIREAAWRSLGKRHYDSQVVAGWALLNGELAEMATGEGKTFAATLPACVVALAGYPVHVITVNDYLAQRDAEIMAPLYEFLGLSVGFVVQGMSKSERRQAYGCAVTYCTNKELAFDYLKDGVALGKRNSRLHLALEKLRGDYARDEELVLRGLYFAVVDEADSVFIDEASTPLILSSSVDAGNQGEDYREGLEIARSLEAGIDFELDLQTRRIDLLGAGKQKIETFAQSLGERGVWSSIRAREELVTQGLSALLLYKKDQHYVVIDNSVQIVDESTGRVMPDRSWERGLHQFIEEKEGCELSARKETLARLTYQRLFRRYLRLAGMTGTAQEVAREIKSTYKLSVTHVPLNMPSKRKILSSRLYLRAEQKWHAVSKVVDKLANQEERPVLIGTRSVKASEEISTLLSQQNIEHTLLNAKQDETEALVIASAGQRSRVTVATNIAGRGTDIELEEWVQKNGGLHVILTEYHDSKRVDRQLFGRCARQGDPGSCEVIVSLEDEIYTTYTPKLTRFSAKLLQRWSFTERTVLWVLTTLAQFSSEAKSKQLRTQTMKNDKQLNTVLAFSGRGE
jgi:preprotein translocase subunit SecA